jgi:predicted Zn-dependent peptidase
MQFSKKILSNGLTVIAETNPGAKSAAIGFFVKTGARDESMEVSGVSHFLEHMLFKGTDKLSALEVNQAFDKTGAQFNAFTSEEMTVFYAAILPEHLGQVTELWSQLMRPSLRDDDFNLEKNVIKQEIAMYKDLPQFEVFDEARKLHFGNHACSQSVLGTVDSIDALSCEQMRGYFEKRYAPNNIIAAIAGNLDFDACVKIIEENSKSWKSFDVQRELSHFAGTKEKKRIENASFNREHICLVHEGVSAQSEKRFAGALLANILGDDVGSRFYWKLVDTAIAESATTQFSPMDGTGAFFSYILCAPEDAGKAIDIANVVLDEICRDGITEQELTAARNKLLSEIVIKNELPMGRLLDLGFNWLYSKEYCPIAKDVEAIKAVTKKDIEQMVKDINLRQYTRLSLGPAVK